MRILRPVLLCLVWSGLVIPQTVSAAAAPSIDTLLPKSAVGFVSATNFPRLAEQWNKTQIGKLMQQPVMKPFAEDLHTQLQTEWSELADRLGIHLDDLRDIPTGESSLALIQTTSGTESGAATTLLMDVTDNGAKAQNLLNKAIKGLQQRGAAQTILNVQGVRVYTFDVPLPSAAQAAVAAGGAPAAPAASSLTVYFLANNVFCACDDLKVTKDIIGRLVNGGKAGSLAQVVSYQMTMKRCEKDAPGHVPNIRWFIYPLGYAEATRASTPAEKRKRGKTIIEIMRKQGFGAFQGVGGWVDVSSDGYQIVHRTAVYAPKTWDEKSSMNMFVFPPGKDFTPQPWVGRDVASYFTAYVDVLNAFDHFGPLYDEVIDAPGVWAQTLEQMKTDPNGPQIDLRNDLVKFLGPRVTMVADYRLPITTTSERLLWAVESKNDAKVAAAIEKCVNNDPTIKKREVNKQVIWEIVEEADTGMPQLNVDVPSLTPKKDNKSKPEAEDDQEKEGHFLPHGAFAVANGQLFIATHIDFLKKALTPVKPAEQLATQPEFLKVWDITFNKLGMKQQSSRSFSWTDRAIEPSYELIRQGKMPQSESLLGRTLNSLAAAGKKGAVRQQRIRGDKLPDFKVVAPALGPATASMTAEPDGMFVKGVLVTK